MRKPEWCIKEKKKKNKQIKQPGILYPGDRTDRKERRKKKEYYFSAPISNMLTVSFGRHLEKKHAGKFRG